MTSLGFLDGGTSSSAADASGDASVIVGTSGHAVSANNGPKKYEVLEAYRWTEQTGMVPLGDLDGGRFNSRALGVSRDGIIVVGWGDTDQGPEAFVWDAANGMRRVSELLGSTLPTGWTLTQAWNVASDGTTVTIVGEGVNPSGVSEGWVARIAAPDTDTPVASGDSYSVKKDNVLTVGAPGVLGNDVDPNGDPLTAVLDVGPANGSVTLNADGSFTYTPNAGFTGTDSFTYLATDGTNLSDPATVTITVTSKGGKPGGSSSSLANSTLVASTGTTSETDPALATTGDTSGPATTTEMLPAGDTDLLPQPTQTTSSDTDDTTLVDLAFSNPATLDDPLLGELATALAG